MTRRFLATALAGVAGLAAAFTVTAAQADPVEDFYKGRSITLYIGYGAGGGFGLYGRLLTEHMGRHIPGKPSITPQFMPGAGSVKAANYLYNVAPGDGTAIGMFAETMPTFQLLEPRGFRLDTAKWHWIGRMDNMSTVLIVRTDAPATSIEDMRKTKVILGATGRSSPGYLYVVLMNKMIGTQFDIVSGYPGSADIMLAVERGEVHGRVGAWASFKSVNADLLARGVIEPAIEIGLTPSPDIQHLPLLKDLGETEEARESLRFMSVGAEIGRAFVAPPDVPAERVEALRRAFDATMQDSEFLRVAKERNVGIDPMKGEDLQKLVEDTVAASPDLVRRTQEALGLLQ